MIIKSHYMFGNKLIIKVDGDVYAMRVQEAVQDLFFSQYKGKANVVVIFNDLKRSRTLSF